MIIKSRDKKQSSLAQRGSIPKSTKIIGQGTFGQIAAFTYNGESLVAKKFTFCDSSLHLTTLREIKALTSIKSRYIVKVEDIVIENYRINMVMPYYETDLYKLIDAENLTLADIKHIFWQILSGVNDIHTAGYIHRDLKTANILINRFLNSPSAKRRCGESRENTRDSPEEYIRQSSNADSGVYEARICDFGMCRVKATEMTPYMVTLWYRAPELLLGAVKYTKAVDVWSLGCILLEMFNKKVVFKASTEVELLGLICGQCGSIDENSMTGCSSLPLYSKYRLPDGDACILSLYSKHSMQGADLAFKMLQLDPTKRPTVSECLQHPFFIE